MDYKCGNWEQLTFLPVASMIMLARWILHEGLCRAIHKSPHERCQPVHTRFSVIVGNNELETGKFRLRDMAQRKEENLSFDEILKRVAPVM